MDIYDILVKYSDKIGLDFHLVRYLILALFDQRVKNISEITNKYDLFYLLFIIIPMFIIGLRFWTSPVYFKYISKINSLSVPFALPVMFYAHHSDIKMLGFLVLIMNFYVFWYHADPSYDEYNNTSL